MCCIIRVSLVPLISYSQNLTLLVKCWHDSGSKLGIVTQTLRLSPTNN